MIADLNGKGGHIRTVPMQDWVKRFIDEWAALAAITSGPLFRFIPRLFDCFESCIQIGKFSAVDESNRDFVFVLRFRHEQLAMR